ncbi:hypothetical protein I4U23_023134 [Adineta vaga]|nr:hypothetical protein I4U23_023134 [Adineta vaga]
MIDVLNNNSESIQDHDGLDKKFSSGFSLLNLQSQSSLHLTRESALFIWYRLLSSLVKDVQCDSYTVDNINNSTDISNKIRKYVDRDDDNCALDEFQKHYSPTNAIYWYTKNVSIYRLLNNAIRTRDIDILYTFKSLIIDLQTQLEQLSTAAPKKLASSMVTLYRGARIQSNDLEKLKANIGSFISLNTFMSTTRDRNIALNYIEAYQVADNDGDTYPIIYEINCSLDVHSTIFADVEGYSINLNEKEFLFAFSTVFVITNVESNENIWTVKLCNTSKHTQLVDNYVDVAKREMKENSSELLFGRLLFYLGEYKTADTYIKQIAPLLLTKEKYEDIARFCFDIGGQYYRHGEIDFALETYNSTLKFSANDTLIARTLQMIANVYFERDDYERALNYYHRILESKEMLNNCNSLLSTVYTAMGMIYQKEQKFENALYYYNQAMKIDSKQDRLSLINSIENIASVYEEMNNYHTALTYYMNAQKIRLNTTTTNHVTMTASFLNLATLCTLVDETKLALEYYLHALYIQKSNLEENHPEINETIAKITRLTLNEEAKQTNTVKNSEKILNLVYIVTEKPNCVTQEETNVFSDTLAFMNFIRTSKEKASCIMCVVSHDLMSVEILHELDNLENVHSIIDYNPLLIGSYSGYSKTKSMATTLDQLQFHLSHNLATYYRQAGDQAIEHGEFDLAEKYYRKSQTYLKNVSNSVPIEEEEDE